MRQLWRKLWSPLWRLLADGARGIMVRYERYQNARCENLPEARGIRLLKEWLSPEQLAQFEAKRYFDVVGCHSGRIYRIRHGASMNILELGADGRPRVCWCFVPDPYLVPGDVMLAQKIALETDERAALAVANEFTPERMRPDLRVPF